MRLRLVKEPFDNPDYIFELKHDGFRATVFIENSGCRLVSRNLKNLRFESLKVALAKLPVRNAILYAFDLLWLDGKDLRQLPLVERKSRLAQLVGSSKNDCCLPSTSRARAK